MNKILVSDIDKKYYSLIRENVSAFLKKCAIKYDDKNKLLLDIAPQIHLGAREHFTKAKIKTFDIDPYSGADYIADLCETNRELITDDYFDLIVCTEVLEHVLNPFKAVKEIYRILKKGGLTFVTTPFNFRIHGPLPDCWRFTEHGLRELFKDFVIIELNAIPTEGRNLMPLHYSLIAKK